MKVKKTTHEDGRVSYMSSNFTVAIKHLETTNEEVFEIAEDELNDLVLGVTEIVDGVVVAK